MTSPTYCQTCGARDDATKRGLEIDVAALIAERDALRAALAKTETDAARWRALVTTFGPEADVSTPHRPHTMLIAIDTEGCEIREDGHLNFRETLELALDDEILRQKAAEDALNAIQRARTKP